MKTKGKIGILSLGCPRNLVDSENTLGRLNAQGYSLADMDKADIAIVNTCAFIEEARKESIDAILDLAQLKKEGRIKKLIVQGCLPERYKQHLQKELPEVDAFVGRISLNHSSERVSLTARHYAYLKICEGCINNCSYCIIPKIKGKFTSLDMETVVKKAQEFNRLGVSELNIIGQDISGYGLDLYKKTKLVDLLRKITAVSKNIGWLRLLYLNPERISSGLLEFMRDEPKVCRYLDLPLQHINGRILKLMNRGAKKNDILGLIAKIRKMLPGIALRTAFIVGFPSETENEFNQLLAFIKEVRFERLGAFVYSREEGTAAYDFKKQVPQKIKLERFNAIMQLQQEISREANKEFIGKSIKVLIDEKDDSGYLARSEFDAPEVDGLVYVNTKMKLKPGDFINVRVTDTLEYDLVAQG